MNLCLTGVTVRLGRRDILRDLNLTVDHGVTGLVGRNGAGKTTLMRTMAGVIVPAAGTVERDGNKIFLDGLAMRNHRRGLGWLPQELGLPPRMRVDEFVSYAAWLKEIGRSDRAACVEDALVGTDMSDLRSKRLGNLSGGQRRRAALSAAIVGMPDLLLLDEPTNGLDPDQRSRFLEMIRDFAENRTVILASHLLEDLALAADQWFTLDTGTIIGSGSIDRSSTSSMTASLEAIRSTISVRSRNRVVNDI